MEESEVVLQDKREEHIFGSLKEFRAFLIKRTNHILLSSALTRTEKRKLKFERRLAIKAEWDHLVSVQGGLPIKVKFVLPQPERDISDESPRNMLLVHLLTRKRVAQLTLHLHFNYTFQDIKRFLATNYFALRLLETSAIATYNCLTCDVGLNPDSILLNSSCFDVFAETPFVRIWLCCETCRRLQPCWLKTEAEIVEDLTAAGWATFDLNSLHPQKDSKKCSDLVLPDLVISKSDLQNLAISGVPQLDK